MRPALNVLRGITVSLPHQERAILGDHEVGVALIRRFELRSAENKPVEVGMAARLVEVEGGLQGVVTGSVIACVPERSSWTALYVKARAFRREGQVGPIIGILGILATVDPHLPAFRGLGGQWQSYTAGQ